MSDAQKLIAQVLQQHHFVTELQFDGTKLYHCEKCCGTKVCVAHSVEEYRAHLAAEINKALGGLTRETRTNAMSSSGMTTNYNTGEIVSYSDIRRDARWASGWKEASQ